MAYWMIYDYFEERGFSIDASEAGKNYYLRCSYFVETCFLADSVQASAIRNAYDAQRDFLDRDFYDEANLIPVDVI